MARAYRRSVAAVEQVRLGLENRSCTGILRFPAASLRNFKPMPDIVPNLLHLSSEVADVADLLEPALDLVLSATGAEAAAIRAGHAAELVDRSGPRRRQIGRAIGPGRGSAGTGRCRVSRRAGWQRRLSATRATAAASQNPNSCSWCAANVREPQLSAIANRVVGCARHRRATSARDRPRRSVANDSRHHTRVASDERNGNAARADGRSGHAVARCRSGEHLPVGQAEQDDRRPAGAGRQRRRAAIAG